MQLDEIPVPTVEQYKAAFAGLQMRNSISRKQQEMLKAHHDAPAHSISATKLATTVGYKSYRAVNSQYGRLARKVISELGITLPRGYVAVGILVGFVNPGYAENPHWLWVLRPNVAKALEQLGWVKSTSDFLYP
jgi:hypothetical protein